MAANAFYYLFKKEGREKKERRKKKRSQVFSTCYLPKVALLQASIVSVKEAR